MHAGALAIAPHPEGASHGHHVVPAWMLRAIPTSKAAADLINLDPPYTLEDVGKLQRQVHEYPDAEPEPHPEPTSELYRTFLCARRGSMLRVDKTLGRRVSGSQRARGRPRGAAKVSVPPQWGAAFTVLAGA